ncbi:DUF2161 family putative PD-(D/E)XK-type phosphodiesterase [Sutcliffiella deserti]|uniref:DUF2161 family putative PD-(D/E)XK-type phosphodiesterase n=1 Tax=Sutcliffiella deserti TaxID=2875501 RepID=UPI00295C0721|nr:DUF2161 family putative PD-(D/E)XK-type phosphodiesterase [Sutcliffiella deserti]
MMEEKKKIYEMDLYKPIQKHFVKEGYEVYGEVNDCDIAMVKEEEVVVIELKLTLNVHLLIQATKRQRLTDQVYIAIPRPTYSLRSKRWTDLCHLIRRLELGLIVVTLTGKRDKAEVVFSPTPFDRSKSIRQGKRKRDALLKEMNGRSTDTNIGGSNRTKIMTAYKENCIQIAAYLHEFGPLSPKRLVELGTGAKTSSILTKNYYNWFDRIKRGTYCLSEKGKKELGEYGELAGYYLEKVNKEEGDKGK